MPCQHQIRSTCWPRVRAREWALNTICRYEPYPARQCHRACSCVNGTKNDGNTCLKRDSLSQNRLSIFQRAKPNRKTNHTFIKQIISTQINSRAGIAGQTPTGVVEKGGPIEDPAVAGLVFGDTDVKVEHKCDQKAVRALEQEGRLEAQV
jgi:hypothetical protein